MLGLRLRLLLLLLPAQRWTMRRSGAAPAVQRALRLLLLCAALSGCSCYAPLLWLLLGPWLRL